MALRPPQIGEYTPQVPVEEGLRRVIPEARGISAGPEISELGSSVNRVAISEASNFTLNAMSQAQGQWTQQLQHASETAAPGAPGFTGAFMDQYGKYVDQTLKAAPNDIARRQLQMHLTEFGNTLATRASAFELQARTDHNVDSFKGSVDTADNELMLHPEVYDQRLAERTGALNNLLLDPQTKEKLALYGRNSLAKAATEGAINRDPMTALSNMFSDKPTSFYADLSPSDRQELQQHALAVQRELNSADEHQLLMNERLQKQSSDTLAKQGDDLLAKHQMTQGWLTQHQSIMEPSEYRYFSRRLSGAEQVSDPTTYSDLLTRAQGGEDVSQSNRFALTHGLLKEEDYTRIQDNVSSERPGWFKLGTQMISRALEPSPGDVVHNPELRKTQTLALEAWQDFQKKNPNASDSEARSQQDLIINQYSMVAQDRTVFGMRAPLYLLGTRTQPVDESGNPDPTLTSTIARTQKALADKKITPEEALDQAKLIHQYQLLYQKAAAARAAQAKKAQP